MKSILQVVENLLKPYIDSHDRTAEAIIAPVETDATSASDDYAVGKQLILDGVLYDVIAPITAGDALVVNTNIKAANKVSSDIQTLTNEVSARATLGAHNLLPKSNAVSSWQGLSFTNNSDGSFTVSGTASENLATSISPTFTLKKGTYILHVGAIPSGTDIGISDKDGNRITDDYSGNVSFTLSQDTEVYVFFFAMSGTVISSTTIYPMIRLASDTDDTYQPYSMTNQELTPIAQAVSNRNLLDNPWFTVNQRGQNSYTVDGTYTVDRWKLSNTNDLGSVAVGDGLTLDNTNGSANLNIAQTNRYDEAPFKNLLGKTVTLSILLSDGSIFSDSGVIPSTPSSWTAIISIPFSSSGSIVLQANDNRVIVTARIYSSKSATIKAVKLELGSVSTLAQDTAPNYATELLKCQRYFYRLQSDNSYGLLSDLGYVNSTSDVRVPIILPVPMRAKPSVSASGALRVFNAIDNNSMSTAVTLVSPLHSIEGTLGHLRVTATNSDFVSGKIVALAANNDDNAYIDFSADL